MKEGTCRDREISRIHGIDGNLAVTVIEKFATPLRLRPVQFDTEKFGYCHLLNLGVLDNMRGCYKHAVADVEGCADAARAISALNGHVRYGRPVLQEKLASESGVHDRRVEESRR